MTDTSEDLRATSDAVLRDLEVLGAIEAQKRTLEPDDPQLVELAERVEALAARLLASSSRQRKLTVVGKAEVDAGAPSAPTSTIDDTPRPIPDILAEWRAAERRLAAAEPGSAEALEAEAMTENLRQQYRDAHDAHRR